MCASGVIKSSALGRLLLVFYLLATALITSPAEQLPIKTYTTADGLLRDEVNRIKQDSRGFLWFCTNDGLSRFDGYGFTNYTTDDGLPHRVVNDLLETRSGVLWIATNNGFILVFSLLRPVIAQDNSTAKTQHSADAVTAFASTERVRFTAPSSVVQMHLEVYVSLH
jgi:ligand-binding sensor domain-containing protein